MITTNETLTVYLERGYEVNKLLKEIESLIGSTCSLQNAKKYPILTQLKQKLKSEESAYDNN